MKITKCDLCGRETDSQNSDTKFEIPTYNNKEMTITLDWEHSDLCEGCQTVLADAVARAAKRTVEDYEKANNPT